MANKIEKYIRTLPKAFKPSNNPVLNAFLKAFASSDDEIVQQIENTKAQLFVRTAEGRRLDQLATSLGVSRPIEIGLDDAKFQELIPNLSLKAKQVRKSFYDTSDVFWGPLFSRANTETSNAATFNVSPGDEFQISIDDGVTQSIKVLPGDVQVPGFATAEEIASILSKIEGATISIIEDALTGDEKINIRTNTPGPRGAIEIFQTGIIATGKLEFTTSKVELSQQDQRVMIYEIRPNEFVFEIPAIIPALRRTLLGSHHFHTDSTLEGPVAPANGIWQGSFLFNPDGSNGSFTVTGQNAVLESTINKGTVLTSITVDDTSNFEESTGSLIFGWGTGAEEVPVRFRGVPNSKTILVDPAYQFQKDHAPGEIVNVLQDQRAYSPNRDGSDLAVYLTSPAGAREAAQEILRTLAAEGVIVNFVILAPVYKYLIDNPYLLDSDD